MSLPRALSSRRAPVLDLAAQWWFPAAGAVEQRFFRNGRQHMLQRCGRAGRAWLAVGFGPFVSSTAVRPSLYGQHRRPGRRISVDTLTTAPSPPNAAASWRLSCRATIGTVVSVKRQLTLAAAVRESAGSDACRRLCGAVCPCRVEGFRRVPVEPSTGNAEHILVSNVYAAAACSAAAASAARRAAMAAPCRVDGCPGYPDRPSDE